MALPAGDLVQIAGIANGAQVLDVGTGTGVVAREAARLAMPDGRVVGVDQSFGMLTQAGATGGSPQYAGAAAIDLPFRDDSFTHVLASFVLSHFARYETALFDMMRVLRPGGRMGVTAWGPGDDEFSRAWDGVAEQFAEQEILRDARQRAMPWADLFTDANRLRDVLHDAELRDIRIERRQYQFGETTEEYLESREIGASGRFLRQMLGDELWEVFRRRTREVFAERFPPRFSDFRDVNIAVGHKP